MGARSSSRRRMTDSLMDASPRALYQQRVTPLLVGEYISAPPQAQVEEGILEDKETKELSVSFGYQCKERHWSQSRLIPDQIIRRNWSSSISSSPDDSSSQCRNSISKRSRSFSCLSGAALGANATLANTAICNGLIGEEILPGLDSPRTFRKLQSNSPRMLDMSSGSSSLSVSSSLSSSCSLLGSLESTSAPMRMESASFLSATDVQMAGGAAGEDRVQAVCSEENGWLFCGIYDGFNGRDAADYLAGTFYENIGFQLRLLEWQLQKERAISNQVGTGSLSEVPLDKEMSSDDFSAPNSVLNHRSGGRLQVQQQVLEGLQRALVKTETDFMDMVEQEMDQRQELAMVGSCLLAVLLHGEHIYSLNLGDSRAILATSAAPYNTPIKESGLYAVQLTELHELENDRERDRLLMEHPDDPGTIRGGRIKGKLKVSRAFGAGYLKMEKLNSALMGILRVKDLFSPPYISSNPFVRAHEVASEDSFVVMGSDGLFDFFNNEEVVDFVYRYLLEYPTGDPAKYMLEQLLVRAADSAGITVDQLKNIPIGRRRKYHDDVTIMVVLLGAEFRTTSASTIC